MERLGLLSEIAAAHPDIDPREWVRQRAAELTRKEKEENKTVNVKLSPTRRIAESKKRMYHGGDLFLQPFLHRLGIKGICDEIQKRSKHKFDLQDIVSKLVYGRVLFPDSKLSTWQSAQNFIEHPTFELEDIYRALSVMARESDYIQSQLYHNSMVRKPRNAKVIYYDCSNYYFEIESDDDFRKYGHSKEHRPNPIVQLGMFMDADGLPLAFCVNPGNTPETQTMQPLEEKLATNFNLSDFVACTDGGLGSVDNRMYNMTEGRDYITVLSLKNQRKTRAEQIARAQTKIDRGESTRPKSPNDCRRLIHIVSATAEGEVAEHTISQIDWDKVSQEERFDGFYAYGTSLDDPPP